MISIGTKTNTERFTNFEINQMSVGQQGPKGDIGAIGPPGDYRPAGINNINGRYDPQVAIGPQYFVS